MASVEDKKKREKRFQIDPTTGGRADKIPAQTKAIVSKQATPEKVPSIVRAGRDTQKKLASGTTLTPATPGGGGFDASLRDRGQAIQKGGADVVSPRGEVMESSDWLKGDVWSSHKWQQHVDGKLNPNYDPTAIMPAGYFNEGGTFIAGPRVKAWEPLYHARTPREREIAMSGYAAAAGKMEPDTGVESELARRGEQSLANIRGQYVTQAERIRSGAGVAAASIGAGSRESVARIGAGATAPDQAKGIYKYNESTGKYYHTGTGEEVSEISADLRRRWNEAQMGGKEAAEDFLVGLPESIRRILREAPADYTP